MNDRNRRSAAEVMANAARVVKAAVNIVRARSQEGFTARLPPLRRSSCRRSSSLPSAFSLPSS